MPRAGSGWYYNLTNELMLAHGAQDARCIRQHYRLQGILSEVNCNIGALTPRRLLAVLVPSLLGNTFVIKAHAGPTPMARILIRRRWMRAAYIYRDPRDALLSAYENGQRLLQMGRSNAFSDLVDFEAALRFMLDYVLISEAWLGDKSVLHARYENLLQDYEHEAGRLVRFLLLDPHDPSSREVIAKFRPKNLQAEQKGLHFNKGKVGRFRLVFNHEQQERMRQAFCTYLDLMDYPV